MLVEKEKGNGEVVSADHYFIGEDGRYHFDPTKLADAHNACMRRFVELVTKFHDSGLLVLVDNTNIDVHEIAPYAQVGLAFGASVEIVSIHCDPEMAYRRNVHGVPLSEVQAMALRMVRSEAMFPSWWRPTVVDNEASLATEMMTAEKEEGIGMAALEHARDSLEGLIEGCNTAERKTMLAALAVIRGAITKLLAAEKK